MDGLVDQDSPAVQLPGSAPATRVVIGLGAPPPHLRGSRGEAAEPSFIYRLMNGLRGRVEAVLAYDGNPPAGGTLDLEQTVRRLQGDVDGLLDDGVLARLEHGYGNLGVPAARGADAHSVEIHTREHLPEVAVRGATILAGQLLGQFRHD